MAGLYPVLRLEIGQFSDPGRKRTNNEDWLGTFQPDDSDPLDAKGSLFLVADGMGGHRSGEMASRRAVDQVIRTYYDDPDVDPAASLQRAFRTANAALYAQADEGTPARRAGTTLVAAAVRQDKVWIANIGDSRAYLLRNGKLRRLSRDHSWASAGAEVGLSENWIGRHIITRALGLKQSIEVDTYVPLDLQVGDRILLCTDGLTAPLADDKIEQIASHHTPQRAAEVLVQAANDQGGPDNVSVILIEVTGRSTVLRWQGIREFLSAPFDAETWQKAAISIQEAVPGREKGLRSPILIGILVLVVLALIGLGFVLGLILFR